MESKQIKEEIAGYNEEALFLDGLDGDKDSFNEALIGFGERCSMNTLAVYSIDKILEILENKFEMSYEEAREWYDYNIAGAWMGDNTPICVYDLREV